MSEDEEKNVGSFPFKQKDRSFNLMLFKNSHLKKKKDFERVFKKGKSVNNDFLVLKFLPSGLANSRFGIIVSQKVSKKAVVRNKIRRRIRETIRLGAGKIGNQIDAVVICRPGIEKKSFGEIQEIVEKALRKAGVIQNND